ncbi:hypothetical protein JKA74_16505 [Marivirga sp. S37H4]|uniref:Uncharacterized protein n=1 Tax=Marivirga aurantiaca TaxID=2802615 RepID=A0A935CAN8_9BACT|nr:hypothetical protein [Marivirga aurantiaca]MBK6266649.1 hypothetical protein [Marivirga aurantiaca]
MKFPSIELILETFLELEKRGFQFPVFRDSDEIIIFSDYSGEQGKTSKYTSYSFYILPKSQLKKTIEGINVIRKEEEHWIDNSFIEYKKIGENGDKVRKRILPRFLRTIDKSEGLIVTFLLNKNSPDYFFRHSSNQNYSDNGLNFLKPDVLRKTGNILSIISAISKKFIPQNCSLFWYSDRDDIFGGNQKNTSQTLDILLQLFNYLDINLTSIKFDYDKNEGPLSDLMAVADLSAGGVLEYYQNVYQGSNIKESSKQLIGWMNENNSNLKKLMLIGREDEKNKYLETIRNY